MDKIANPASRTGQPAAERKRIPMGVPVQKLEAPDMPGFHLHWFQGTPERVQRAIDGGYEFVDERDMKVSAVGLGSTSTATGNTDMGSRVSVVSGTELGRDGQPVRLILMKIRQEWFEEDQKLVEQRNELVAASLRGGMIGVENDRSGDANHRYVDASRTKIPDLFTPKRRPKAAA